MCYPCDSRVHLREGRTLGGSCQDHRRSGKSPKHGPSQKGYTRGKGKGFVRRVYIAEVMAMAYPEGRCRGFGYDA